MSDRPEKSSASGRRKKTTPSAEPKAGSGRRETRQAFIAAIPAPIAVQTTFATPGTNARESLAESNRSLLYGRRPVQAYLDSLPEGDADATRLTNVESILLGESLPKKLREELLRKLPGVAFAERPRRLLDQEFPDLHHQGVILRFRRGSGPENKARDLDWKDFVREPAGLLVFSIAFRILRTWAAFCAVPKPWARGPCF